MGAETNHDDLAGASLDLHRRILAGDPTAESELAELLLPQLTARLERKYNTLKDPGMVNSAVVDALLNYFRAPNQYKTEIGSLWGYLLMSAERDLLNLLKPRKSDRLSVPLAENVELRADNSEYGVKGAVLADPTNVEDDAIARLSPIAEKLRSLFPDPVDRELLDLLLNGVRETDEYARVLGIEHLDATEKRSIVKRHKDRIKKSITRNIDPKDLRHDH